MVGVGGWKDVDDEVLECRSKRTKRSFGHSVHKTIAQRRSPRVVELDGLAASGERQTYRRLLCNSIGAVWRALTSLALFPFGYLQIAAGKRPLR